MSSDSLSNSSVWTRDQDKQFEIALALFTEDSSDRWENIAKMVPGKNVEDIKHHYMVLVEDIDAIESGLVPLPQYTSSSEDFVFGKRGSLSRSDQERRKGIAWTEEEHRLFLMGLDKYGKGDWRSISRNYVVSRTPTQVASHAQKYFKRLSSANKERRRSSIHDITSAGGGASTSQGPITGQTDGSRDVRPEPLSQPLDVSTYVPPTIVESADCSIISAVDAASVDAPSFGAPGVGTPANLPFTPDMFFDIGALSPDSLLSGLPMDMASMTCL